VGDGTYEVTYTVTVSGEYELLVLLDGVALAGSPFRLVVKAGIACPSSCLASGAGLHEARAGERAKISVRAVDLNGQMKSAGGDFFVAALHGPFAPSVPDVAGLTLPASLRLRLGDQRNGHYVGTYTVTAAGSYMLELLEETTGTPVHGSPFRVEVLPGPLHPPSCRLTPALTTAPPSTTPEALTTALITAGEQASVDVALFDEFGNALPHAAARGLRVRFATPETAPQLRAKPFRTDPPSPPYPRQPWSPLKGSSGARSGSGSLANGGSSGLTAASQRPHSGFTADGMVPVSSGSSTDFTAASQRDEAAVEEAAGEAAARDTTLGVYDCRLLPLEHGSASSAVAGWGSAAAASLAPAPARTAAASAAATAAAAAAVRALGSSSSPPTPASCAWSSSTGTRCSGEVHSRSQYGPVRCILPAAWSAARARRMPSQVSSLNCPCSCATASATR
jgi:hypothetical protein